MKKLGLIKNKTKKIYDGRVDNNIQQNYNNHLVLSILAVNVKGEIRSVARRCKELHPLVTQKYNEFFISEAQCLSILKRYQRKLFLLRGKSVYD